MASQPLTSERIVAEAVSLMQEQGLEAVSLRRLAARLGVQAMSIYWHIRNKDELLSLMSQKIYTDAMAAIPPCDDWQSWARAFGHALWGMYHTVRDAARLTFSLNHTEEDFRQFGQGIAQFLTRFGLSSDDAVMLHSAVQALVIGWAGFDRTYGPELGKLLPIEPAMATSLDALIAGLSTRLGSLSKR
jgi:TetR/AcrR family tetracycline transcriptional repressor